MLERQPRPRHTQKAHGLSGQILHLLRYRGILDRFEAATTDPVPPPRFPYGGVHLDLTRLADPPLGALPLRQHRLEALLAERAVELGAEIRRGHEVVALRQDEDAVTAEVRGPDGTYEVTVLENGDLEAPGLRVRAGYTNTDHGVFAVGSLTPGVLMMQNTEPDPSEVDNDEPLLLEEMRESIRRVLGADLPLGEVTRLSRYQFQARQAERYRDGRVFLAGDAAQPPAWH